MLQKKTMNVPNDIFNVISVTSWWSVYLSMLSRHSYDHYSAQYSFQGTGCRRNSGRLGRERNESCRNDYHQSSERILAEPEVRSSDLLFSSLPNY